MKAAHPDEEIETWCEDEARFGLQPVLRRVWAPKGERPVASVAPDYEWLWVYAAAHPSTGASFWLSLPRLDGEMAQVFLDEFTKEYATEGKQIILCWDGAPAHRSKSLRVPERIHLLLLPAYTPELNPAEQLWPLVKEGVANDSFKDLGALEKRVCRRVRRVAGDREMLSSRLCYHWWPDG
ncbi:MAG TPA: IS630 family transposase [Blastocatellia bacterium]|nr:IS630 family transposase [Blastocatellia bacterium]